MTILPFPKNAVALAAICLASLMFGLEISSVPVILPVLENTLHGSFREMQWVMNAYTIACTTVLMATGTLADRYGRKRIFLISVVLFGLTSLVCGGARNAPLLIVGRFLQGMSGGAMLICQVAVLSHQFQQGRQRSKAFGAWGIVFGVGLGFGPIVGGLIVAVASWPWVFLVHGLIAMLTIVLVVAGVQESRDPDARTLDVAGIVTLSLSVFCLAYFITQGPQLGFGSGTALGIAGLAAASFAAFVLAESKAARPMFDFSVFRIRRFSGAIFGSMGMNVSFWPFMIYLPMYFQNGLGYGSVAAGLSLLAYTLPALVVPPFAERLALRYRPGLVIPLGLSTIGLGFLLMRLGAAAAHPGWLTMLPGSVLAGIGLGMTNTPVTNTTTGSVPAARAGMASGIDMSARLITLAIHIALMGFILVEGIRSYLERAAPGVSSPSQLRATAEMIAGGNLAFARQGSAAWTAPGLSEATVHAALVHGFEGIMLYGGIGVGFLALLSFAAFGRRKPACGAAAGAGMEC